MIRTNQNVAGGDKSHLTAKNEDDIVMNNNGMDDVPFYADINIPAWWQRELNLQQNTNIKPSSDNTH